MALLRCVPTEVFWGLGFGSFFLSDSALLHTGIVRAGPASPPNEDGRRPPQLPAQPGFQALYLRTSTYLLSVRKFVCPRNKHGMAFRFC